MADNRGNIYEVWDVQAIEQQQGKAIQLVKGFVDTVLAEDKRLQEAQLGLLGSKNISEMAANSQKVNQMLKNQQKNVEDLTKAKKDQLDLDIRSSLILRQNAEAQKAENEAKLAAQRLLIEMNREKERLANNAKKEEENTRKQSSAYEQLKKQYNDAAKATLDLGAKQGATSKEFLESAANVKKLHDQLYTLESAIGRSQRNVGNYASAFNGMNNAINQISRELPAFANSVQTGLMAISNNIAPLKDAIDQVRLKNAELVAQGKEAIPVWKQIGASIISWNTALSVGVTLLTVFGPKLFDMLTGSSEAAKEAEKANKKYAESLKSIEENAMKSAYEETARLQLLEQVATDENATREKRNQAIKEMRKMGPEYLKLYDDEAIKAGKAKEAIKELTEALLQKAVAEAASQKYAAAFLREREIAKSEEKALNDLVGAKQKLADFDAKTAKQLEGLKGEREEAAIMRMQSQRNMLKNQVNAAQEDYDNIYKQRTGAITEYLDYKNQASEAMKNIPNLFGDDKQKKTGAVDTTNKELDNGKRLLEARAALRKTELEQSVQNSKAIVDYEENTMDQRMNALTEYFESKRALLNIDKNTELATIESKLQKIEEIEGKSADKRTKQEKALLTEKETLEAEKAAIAAKYAVKENDIMVDSNKLYTKIVDDEIADAERKYKAKVDYEQRVANELYKIWDEEARNKAAKEKEALAQRKEALKALKDYSNLIFSKINEFSASNANREIDDIRRKGEVADKDTERQINALNKTLLGEKEYEKQKADIEARATLRKQQQADREAQIKQRQANFEKEMAIMQATLSFLVGVATEGKKGIVGLFTSGALLTYMSTILSQMNSTQVATYEFGTKGHGGGPAIVGEGVDKRTGKFKPEVVKEPGKSAYWVTSPTFYENMPAGTEVLTVEDLMNEASADMVDAPVKGNNSSNSDSMTAAEVRALRKDIANQPKHVTALENGELVYYVEESGRRTKHYNALNR